jgi:flavin-dependent dehydrogenase
MNPAATDFDVIVLGGSLAGSATAFLLLQELPQLRVAVIEKTSRHTRKVGEATVEVSGFFLTHALGLMRHLNECHLTKQGMRFWFANDDTRDLAGCSEIGGRYLARVPAWQVDRAVLDEEMLTRAAAAGATVLRPAKALGVVLKSGGRQTVRIEEGSGKRDLTARWVVDASGFAALLARQEGWFRRNEAHPTTAVWTRWRGVADWDGLELARRFPEWAAACRGVRGTATNHFTGDGWWAWCIPLKGGDFSIGAVFDQRRVTFPAGGSVAGRLRTFLERHPAAREILNGATAVEGDSHWRSNLAYVSDRVAGDGFVLVGDAAGFLDPFYSPGMDWLAYTVIRGVETIRRQWAGEALEPLLAGHNAAFAKAYERWFEGLYRDKYDTMGDFELMTLAFKLDLAMYYVGVVSQPLERGVPALRDPVFTLPASRVPYWVMRHYSRRLARMARERRTRGVFGRFNTGRRALLNGFLPERSYGLSIVRGLLSYIALEMREGWRTWFRAGPERVATPDSLSGRDRTGALAAGGIEAGEALR